MQRFLIVSLGATILLFVPLACSLTGDSGSEAPEVASLASHSLLDAELIIPQEDGYVLAGVAGEAAEPRGDGVCNGRFALVTLNDDGSPRRADVASGPERDRFCAAFVTSAFREEAFHWILSGFASRKGDSGPIFASKPSTDLQTYTLRLTPFGEPDTTFGDAGVVRDAVVIGRAGDATVTNRLERLTTDGEVRDDLIVSRGGPSAFLWSQVLFEEDLLVAVHAGASLDFQAFVADRSRSPARFDALREASLDIGETVLSDGKVALHRGRLYAVVDQYGAHVVAVDPRASRVVRSFGTRGRASLGTSKLVTTAALAVDAGGRLVVAFTTVDHIHGYRLHARRFSPDGAPDPSYGGLVKELGRAPVSDIWVSRVVIDGAGRAVVLDGFNAIRVRLTPDGRLDPSFGGDGIVSEPIAVCELPPARSHAACR